MVEPERGAWTRVASIRAIIDTVDEVGRVVEAEGIAPAAALHGEARAEAVEQGRRDAEKVKEEILDEARRKGEQVLKDAQGQIDAGLRKAQSDLRSSAVDLAILAAGKLLAKNLDDAAQRRLVEEYLADLERQSGESSTLPS